eukprot:6890181-Pyramimonas_sp.AAC.1
MTICTHGKLTTLRTMAVAFGRPTDCTHPPGQRTNCARPPGHPTNHAPPPRRRTNRARAPD